VTVSLCRKVVCSFLVALGALHNLRDAGLTLFAIVVVRARLRRHRSGLGVEIGAYAFRAPPSVGFWPSWNVERICLLSTYTNGWDGAVTVLRTNEVANLRPEPHPGGKSLPGQLQLRFSGSNCVQAFP
jgi:hypothetical protein